MRLLHTIALSAVAAVLVAPITAEAATKRHHHAAKARSGMSEAERDEAMEQRISQMQAQINSLQAKLDQQGTAQVATADQAAQATQVAVAASAKADTAQATASAATVAEAKTGKTLGLMKWASNTQVNGRMFFNASNIHQKTAGANNANSGTGFNIKRFYFGVDHQFSPVFSGTLLMDISNVLGETANTNFVTPSTTVGGNTASGAPVCTTVNGATPGTYSTNCTAVNLSAAQLVGKGFYIKNAFLQAKLDPALVVRLGSAALPWIPYVEGHYGFRHIENEEIDRLNYGTTADWGVHVLGDLAHGLISYQVSAIDGGGYRNVKVTRYVDLEGRLSAQYDGFWAAIGGYTGKRANGVQQLTGAAFPTTFRTARRANAAAGYSNTQFNIGGEVFYAKNWNNVTVNPVNVTTFAPIAFSQDSARGFSVFGNFNFSPKWTVFGRYDYNQPNRITDPALHDHYFNVGLQWEPVKVVDLALVYKRETAQHGAVATTDGVIGCGTAATANSFSSSTSLASGTCVGNGTYDEVGLFGQFKF